MWPCNRTAATLGKANVLARSLSPRLKDLGRIMTNETAWEWNKMCVSFCFSSLALVLEPPRSGDGEVPSGVETVQAHILGVF